MRQVKIYLLTALFFLLGTSLPLSSATTELQEKLGAKNLDAIVNPKFVTILTLVPSKNHSINAVHLNQEEIARLKTNLLDDHNYDFDRVKRCHFKPEVSFKFHGQNDNVVHMFVSPSCNQVLFGMDTFSVLLNYDPVHERFENFVMQLIKNTNLRNKEKVGWM